MDGCDAQLPGHGRLVDAGGSLHWPYATVAGGDAVEIVRRTKEESNEPVFAGAGDFDLDLLDTRTLDGRTQELVYRPTLHTWPAGWPDRATIAETRSRLAGGYATGTTVVGTVVAPTARMSLGQQVVRTAELRTLSGWHDGAMRRVHAQQPRPATAP